MKIFTLLAALSFFALTVLGQEATFNWVKTDLNDGHNLTKMATSGNEAVITGNNNSFYKTKDGGETWDTLNVFNPVYALLDISINGGQGYIASNRAILYDASPDVYTEGFILKTTDGGDTWANIDLTGLGSIGAADVNPMDTLCYGKDFQAIEIVNDTVAYCAVRWFEFKAGTHSGIFKTDDGGMTWINISGDLKGEYITSIVSEGEKVYIGGKKMLYKSTISADTLINIFPLLNGSGSEYINDITIIDENEFYIATTGDSIYYTYNGGVSFGKFGQVKGGNDIFKVNDSIIVTGGTSGKSYVTINNGVTWSSLGIPSSVWEIPGIINDSVYFLTDSKIYKIAVSNLADGNNSNFSTQDVGNGNLQKAFIEGNKCIIVGSGSTFISSVDGGQIWNDIKIPENPALNDITDNIDFNGLSQIDNTGYVSFGRFKWIDYAQKNDIYWSGGILYSNDNWETVKTIDVAKIGNDNTYKNDSTLNPNHNYCNGVNIQSINYLGKENSKDVLLVWVQWYVYTGDNKQEYSRIFKTSDGGSNWKIVTDNIGDVKSIKVIEAKNDTVYAGGNKTLLKSTDGGNSFTDIYPNLDPNENNDMFVNSVWIGEENEIFVATTADSIYMSANGGETFSRISDIKGSNDFYKFDRNSYIILGANADKSVFTNDNGTTWQDCFPGSAVFKIGGVFNNQLYALAKGAFYTVDIDDLELTTSIPLITKSDILKLQYHADHINIMSMTDFIESCYVYSISGKLVAAENPNSNICRLNNSEYQPGIYIVAATVKGQRFVEKIVFK